MLFSPTCPQETPNTQVTNYRRTQVPQSQLKLSQQGPYMRLLRSYPESCMAIRGHKKLKEPVEVNVQIASRQQNTTIIAWPIQVFFPVTQNVNPFEFRNCRA